MLVIMLAAELLLVNSFEIPPPNKRVRTVEDGMEQLQPTSLDSEETTTTGEAGQEDVLWHMCKLYLNHIPTHVLYP